MPLVIVGASARAAAFSALRAGWSPWCADLFADVDLGAVCPVTRIHDYPRGLESLLDQAPAGDWIYTGALENDPDLVERLSRSRRLLGNSPATLRRARDPFVWSQALARASLRVLACEPTAERLPTDGSWLRKRIRSSAGSHVHAWRGQGSLAQDPDWFFQQRIEGRSCGAVFVAAAGRSRLLGVSEQLLFADKSGQDRFRYAGSRGPLVLDEPLRAELVRLGEVLAAELELVGLFGVDVVLASGQVWPVEINPRYTASVEVLELGLGLDAMRYHLAACLMGELPGNIPQVPRGTCLKWIMRAPRDEVISPEFVACALARNVVGEWPRVADIPAPGTRIRAGQPILTLIESSACSSSAVRQRRPASSGT